VLCIFVHGFKKSIHGNLKVVDINPLPCGTLATFFLTAVGQIQHTKEDDIGREKDDSVDVTAA
jgi:hypothetical protein